MNYDIFVFNCIDYSIITFYKLSIFKYILFL